jgi:hypothetical protein
MGLFSQTGKNAASKWLSHSQPEELVGDAGRTENSATHEERMNDG